MTKPRGYTVVSQAQIVALLPASVRTLADKLDRDVTTMNERLGIMAAKSIVHVGERKKIGTNNWERIYYPGSVPPSPRRDTKKSASAEAAITQLIEEVDQLSKTIKKSNEPTGLQYGVPAPLDTELLLLSTYGKFVIGFWKGLPGDLYTAWAYLPKRNLNSEMLLAKKLSLIPAEE